jgi:hypothetical protein
MIATNEVGNTLITLDPVLRRFSEQQLAVATTWAKHFCVPLEEQRQFIRDYLKATSTPQVWCVTLEREGQQIAIARFGNILQWFDGTTIRTTRCDSKHRIPKGKPGPRAAIGLAERMETLPLQSDGGLLTSFAQKARDWACEIARNDLGRRSVHLAGLDTRSPHLRYLRPKSRYYLRLIGATLREFCSVLDAEILFTIRSVQCVSPQLYNWLATGDKKRRLQALRAQPLLLPMLILSAHRDTFPWPYTALGVEQPLWTSLKRHLPSPTGPTRMGNGNELLGDTVDHALPLSDVLAWLLQAPKASIRYLGSCRPGRTGGALFHIRGAGHEAWERMLLGASLGNRRPASKGDWSALYLLLDKIPYQVTSPHYRSGSNLDLLDLNLLLKGMPTSWKDLMCPAVGSTLTDYQEFYRHLDYTGPGQRVAEVVTQYFARKNLAQITNKVHQFHAYVESVQQALHQELGSEEDELMQTWPALLPAGSVVCPNGISVVELRCPADLNSEHVALKHCIDTYDYSAYQGRCRLVSLRHDGRVLASAEICLASDLDSNNRRPNQKFYCVQLRGLRNQPVLDCSAEGRAFSWFMQGLESGRIPSSQDWPSQTSKLRSHVKSQWAARLSEAAQSWITEHMGDVP